MKRSRLFEADDDTDVDSEEEPAETERRVITWQRVNDYQLVAMKEICTEILHAMPAYEKGDSPPKVYVPGDLTTQIFTFEQMVKVHVSPHNPGAWALAEDFQEHCMAWNAKRGDLMKKSKTLEIKEGARVEQITSPPPSPPDVEVPSDTGPPKRYSHSRRLSFPNPLARQSSSARRYSLTTMLKGWGSTTDLVNNVTVHHVWATHFLVLLNKHTFVGEEGQLLAGEVHRALDAWLPVVLVHEEDLKRDGCPFDELYHFTPEDLINRGLYKKAVISCRREPLRPVSFSLIAKAMGAVPVQTRFAELAHSPGKAVRKAGKSIKAGARELREKSGLSLSSSSTSFTSPTASISSAGLPSLPSMRVTRSSLTASPPKNKALSCYSSSSEFGSASDQSQTIEPSNQSAPAPAFGLARSSLASATKAVTRASPEVMARAAARAQEVATAAKDKAKAGVEAAGKAAATASSEVKLVMGHAPSASSSTSASGSKHTTPGVPSMPHPPDKYLERLRAKKRIDRVRSLPSAPDGSAVSAEQADADDMRVDLEKKVLDNLRRQIEATASEEASVTPAGTSQERSLTQGRPIVRRKQTTQQFIEDTKKAKEGGLNI